MMKRTVTGLMMGVLLGACSVPSAEMSADYPAYESLEEAVGASDAVIHGRYLSFKEVEMLPEINPTEGDATTNPYYGVDPATVDTSGMGVPTTVSSVEVVEVIAGDLRPGMVIEIRQMGNRDIRETSTVLLREAGATDFLLLLVENSDGVYSLINPQSGAWRMTGDQLVESDELKPLGDALFTPFTERQLQVAVEEHPHLQR